MRITSEIDIENENQVFDIIKRCANGVLCELKIEFSAFIDVTIVDGESIKQLNAQYRGKDKETDVLSFPMYQFKNGNCEEKLELDPETKKVMLGDMILNYSKVKEQAKEYCHSLERECGFLTVHSVLHLLGYDHECGEPDKILMREKEREILKKLNITR